MIKSLTSLRGLFAIAIVLFHRQFHLFDHWSDCGVAFFFILSGFLLVRRHDFTRVDGNGWWQFVRVRLWRIFPLHLVAWALLMSLFLIFGRSYNLLAVTLNALLLHAWVPQPEFYLSANAPVWFLSALLLCYVCYPPIKAALHHVRLRYQVLLMLAVSVAMALVLPLLSKPVLDYTYFSPPLRLLDFVLGMVLGHVVQALPREKFSFAKASVVECCALLILLQVWALTHFTGIFEVWEDALIWWIPLAVLICCLAFYGNQGGVVSRVLSWRPLVWLGEISFEIYVLHGIIPTLYTYYVGSLLGHFGINAYGLPVWAHVIVVIVLSWLVHRYFTEPIRHWSTRKASVG